GGDGPVKRRGFPVRVAALGAVVAFSLSTWASGASAVASPATALAPSLVRCPPAWSFVPFVASPGVPSSPSLQVVSGTGPTDVWGVGADGSGDSLALHFDGSAWSFPPQPTISGHLNAVVAISPTDAWAGGQREGRRADTTLIEHWNGIRWRRVSDAAAAFAEGAINRVVAAGPDDVWAIGRPY